MEQNYNTEQPEGGVPIKMWTRGVPVEDEAKKQLANAARLPIVFNRYAAVTAAVCPNARDVMKEIGIPPSAIKNNVKSAAPAKAAPAKK